MSGNEKVSKGVQVLRGQGHLVEPRVQFGKMWYEIDRRMLATAEEIEHLADGIYSLSELEELYVKRRAESRSQSNP